MTTSLNRKVSAACRGASDTMSAGTVMAAGAILRRQVDCIETTATCKATLSP